MKERHKNDVGGRRNSFEFLLGDVATVGKGTESIMNAFTDERVIACSSYGA